ncbi:hypothetical protein S225a_00500 [Candidatus Brocadiaceae bacterium S225]|uniref:N-acyl amino acid synthase FeeM catalytic core domain-containing protein n=1 Tax=Candidatus Scalindua brodae TaxID=237368 RepID=A0A0B0EMA5_9BACT|nr:MAG: hypothetical protein SCABRO_01065 [Candidatus Scalindua brodae]TWU38004.1 hypothetical protein S225a_00500 [Candidatus Brocadiaceae bacterium S225]
MYPVLEEQSTRHNTCRIRNISFDSEDNIEKCGSPALTDELTDSEQMKPQIGTVSVNNMSCVKLDLTTQERNEIYKLRYSVYVKDLKYHQPCADHKSKMLKDSLDSTGNLFGIFKNNEAIGTVLTNYAKHSNLGYYSELYKMKELAYGTYYNDSSISTKLMVRKDFRSKNLAFRLALATFIKGLNDNIQFNFIDCTHKMVPFYLRLGYKVYRESIRHPYFGHGAVLVLELRNIAHLEECNSPFAKHYRRIMHE